MSGLAINRWIVRRQRKILLYSIVAFILMVTYIAMFQEDIPIRESHYTPLSEQCLSDSASNLINSICLNYSQGLAYGNYCHDLCVTKSVTVDKCIHHAKTYVLIGQSKGEEIVMKVKKTRDMKYTVKDFEEAVARKSSISILRSIYLRGVENEVRSNFGEDGLNLFQRNLDVIFRYIFGKNLSDLSLAEMRSSWMVVGQDELIMTLLHQRLVSFSKYLGICGPMYFIEKTTAYSEYFPEIIPLLSWPERVVIAKSFLNVLREFQRTDMGPLFHCDIQEGNFGITKDNIIKAIDVDLLYGSNKIETVLSGSACTSDQDCKFFDCVSKCNVGEKKCTNISLTNNLQVMCRDIFLPRWPTSGLLSYFQPLHVTKRLNELLNTCMSEEFGTLLMGNIKVLRMMNDLDVILDFSLQSISVL